MDEGLHARWVFENSVPLDLDFADLAFELVARAVAKKRIVQLGESSHCVHEYNRIRNRLVKFLHQSLGFNVIAFEAGIYEAFHTNHQLDRMNAKRAVLDTLHPVWHTHEFVELFEYVQATQETAFPLRVAGFDVQATSIEGVKTRPRYFESEMKRVDSTKAREILELDSWFVDLLLRTKTNDERKAILFGHADELTGKYRRLGPYLSGFSRQIALSTAEYVQILANKGTFEARSRRDRGMASNFTFLANQIFRNEKIIVWAHNGHVAGETMSDDREVVMGELLKRRYGDEIYTLGLYALAGRMGLDGRTERAVTLEVEAGSLESLWAHASGEVSFTDWSQVEESEETRFLFEPISTLQWGKWPEFRTLKKSYDGILFLKNVTPCWWLRERISASLADL